MGGAALQLQVDLTWHGERAVLSLDGELDMANAPVLESALSGGELDSAKAVVLDLERVTFLDSTGLRAILTARELCRARGQLFAVTSGSSQVQRLMSVTGVGEHLRTIATADEAFA